MRAPNNYRLLMGRLTNKIMTLEQIKKAVDQGLTVQWKKDTGVYSVAVTSIEGMTVYVGKRAFNFNKGDNNKSFLVAEEGQKFARMCYMSGKPINEGHVYKDGELYFESDEALASYLRSTNEEDNIELSDEYLVSESYTIGESYYTEWEDEDDMNYIVQNGILTEI